MDRFSIISETVHQVFDVRNQARDKALTNYLRFDPKPGDSVAFRN